MSIHSVDEDKIHCNLANLQRDLLSIYIIRNFSVAAIKICKYLQTLKCIALFALSVVVVVVVKTVKTEANQIITNSLVSAQYAFYIRGAGFVIWD